MDMSYELWWLWRAYYWAGGYRCRIQDEQKAGVIGSWKQAACFSQIVVQSFQSFFFLKVNDFNLAAEGQRPCFSPCREFFSLYRLYMPSVSIKGSRSLTILVTGLAYHYMFLARPRSDRRISLPGLINLRHDGDSIRVIVESMTSIDSDLHFPFFSLLYYYITFK